ncbi:hypothetical protein DFH09DRAFT_1110399 [Mycena vulgaris]|nr:hypothetical protein DFH09DRAFT_1110399 [Mycena vulgaris]
MGGAAIRSCDLCESPAYGCCEENVGESERKRWNNRRVELSDPANGGHARTHFFPPLSPPTSSSCSASAHARATPLQPVSPHHASGDRSPHAAPRTPSSPAGDAAFAPVFFHPASQRADLPSIPRPAPSSSARPHPYPGSAPVCGAGMQRRGFIRMHPTARIPAAIQLRAQRGAAGGVRLARRTGARGAGARAVHRVPAILPCWGTSTIATSGRAGSRTSGRGSCGARGAEKESVCVGGARVLIARGVLRVVQGLWLGALGGSGCGRRRAASGTVSALGVVSKVGAAAGTKRSSWAGSRGKEDGLRADGLRRIVVIVRGGGGAGAALPCAELARHGRGRMWIVRGRRRGSVSMCAPESRAWSGGEPCEWRWGTLNSTSRSEAGRRPKLAARVGIRVACGAEERVRRET